MQYLKWFIIVYGFILFIISKDFIVNENIFIYNWHIYLSIAITLYMVLFKDSIIYQYLKKPNKRPYIQVIIFISVIPFLLILSFENFLFYPFHFIAKNKELKIINLTIKDKYISRYHSKCIKVNEYHLIFNHTICGIKNEIYEKIKKNDKIEFTVEQSIFGETPISYKY